MTPLDVTIKDLAALGLRTREIRARLDDQVSDGYVSAVTARYRQAGELPPVELCQRFYVRVPVSAHAVLRKHARARRMSPNRLAGQLLELVLRQDMVLSILDDGVKP